MKMQVIYAKFIPRLFATTIDLFILSVISTPITTIISKFVYSSIFKNFFVQQQINLSNTDAIFRALYTQSFFEYITNHNQVSTYILCITLLTLLNILLMMLFFVGFWIYTSSSPGKMFMQLKIVDAETLAKPSNGQLFKRFFSYLTAIFGIWSILFTERKQALHDKIAKTVVIKR